jgi:hypothetical protein
VDLLQSTPLGAPYAVQKARSMLAGDFSPALALKHALKDAELAAQASGATLTLTSALLPRRRDTAASGHADVIALVRCGQGWTGPLGPRSRRIDCMIANVVVLVKISMSAPPRTPVYFAMTGAAACSVTASRWALTAAHTFSP